MTKIYFGNLEIDSISRNSAVHHGRNVIIGRHASAKVNQGFGEVHGEDSDVSDGLYAVLDNDSVDMFVSRSAKARERATRLTTADPEAEIATDEEV